MSTEILLSKIGTRLGDLSNLPEEVKKQLLATKDEFEREILSIFTDLDGIANVDEVIVGLYRKYKVIVQDRDSLYRKLYKMSKEGVLESVKKKKAVFKRKDHPGQVSLTKVGTRLGILADLPEDVKKHLLAVKVNEFERQILTVFSDLEGVANVDEIIVGLYRQFKIIVQDRDALYRKLYQMSKEGLLESLKGRKAVFRKKN